MDATWLRRSWFSLTIVAALLWRFAVERCWPLVRFGLWVIGLATVVSLAVFWVNICLYERETGRRYAGRPIKVSPVAKRIAAKLAPTLQVLARDNKEGVIAASGNPVQRFAVRTVYPAGLNAIPYSVEIGMDRAFTYLDSMPMSEIAELMLDHAKSTGCQVHYSVWTAAERK